jgi:transcription initiation factor TFIIF subunit alpha
MPVFFQERLKKEYRTANKQGDTGVHVEDDEDEFQGINKQAKAMQKLIRNREGNDVYESEEDKNPYASSVSTSFLPFSNTLYSFQEEEEEEPVVLSTATAAIQEQQQKIESKAQTTKTAPVPPRSSAASVSGSRAVSPSLPPGQSGHSLVAKRATSPQIPKPKPPNLVRGNSPLGQSSTVQSPVATDGINGDATKGTLKRKADHSTSPPPGPTLDSQAPKQKKRKAATQGTSISSVELESMLLEWLKTVTNATTRDCIHHFTPYLVDAEKKAEFSAMVRKHATLKNGVLVARVGIRATSSAPSPPAV